MPLWLTVCLAVVCAVLVIGAIAYLIDRLNHASHNVRSEGVADKGQHMAKKQDGDPEEERRRRGNLG